MLREQGCWLNNLINPFVPLVVWRDKFGSHLKANQVTYISWGSNKRAFAAIDNLYERYKNKLGSIFVLLLMRII